MTTTEPAVRTAATGLTAAQVSERVAAGRVNVSDTQTSRTVGQMLYYAASQSTSSGTTWYGNVKSTQELTKDAFDAINNQVAIVL